jgi:N,N'-diacetyllegionaminate synthase
MNSKLLGLIPARSGSKGVPGKNIKPLGGVPLLAHTILSAREARCLDYLIISTDSPAYAEVARQWGVEVPWLRPVELASDDTPMIDVVLHALDRFSSANGFCPDAIMVLQPTCPFRSAKTIRLAAETYRRSQGESVIGVSPVRDHPYWCKRICADGSLENWLRDVEVPDTRQELPPAFRLNGVLFLCSVTTVRNSKSFFSAHSRAQVVPDEEALDIDTIWDWEISESLWSSRHRKRDLDWRSGTSFVIAEAGVNHNGDIGIAKKLIDVAVDAKADAVKFQSFRADKLASPWANKADYQFTSTTNAESQLEMLSRLELGESAHRDLAEYCKKKGIVFLSSPFDESSADLLDELGVPAFKIASGEITNFPLLRHVAKKRKRVFLSTGMSTLEEVVDAVRVIRAEGCSDITLLHCVSEYPAPVHQVNLRAMLTLRDAFHLPVGYSDHTYGNETALAAVALGATVIEKHFTLNRQMEGPDHRASLEPRELKKLICQIRSVEAALGDGIKKPAECELSNLRVVRRSLFAACAIPVGVQIREEMLECKRPGTGISPRHLSEIIGRRATKSFQPGEIIDWGGICDSKNESS